MIFLMQYAVCLRYLNGPFCYKHFTLSVKTPFGRVEENDPSWYSNGKRSHRKAKKIGYSQYHQRERKATLWCTQVFADGPSVRGTIQLQCEHPCRPSIFTSWGKTNGPGLPVCQCAFEELRPITLIALSSLGMLPFGPLWNKVANH